jgi:hypothetical protein
MTNDDDAYSRSDMRPFNLLENPIWVFDMENKSMWWANTAAVRFWNAESLDELLCRDFASDMSETVKKRLNSHRERIHKGERFSEQVGSGRNCPLPAFVAIFSPGLWRALGYT